MNHNVNIWYAGYQVCNPRGVSTHRLRPTELELRMKALMALNVLYGLRVIDDKTSSYLTWIVVPKLSKVLADSKFTKKFPDFLLKHLILGVRTTGKERDWAWVSALWRDMVHTCNHSTQEAAAGGLKCKASLDYIGRLSQIIIIKEIIFTSLITCTYGWYCAKHLMCIWF